LSISSAPHNLIVALTPTAAEAWRDFAREFSIDFDARGTSVIDHTAYYPFLDNGLHNTILVPLSTQKNIVADDEPSLILSRATRNGPPILYRGIGHLIPPHFPLAHAILSAPPTAYSYDIPKSSDAAKSAGPVDADLDGTGGPFLSGGRASLVAAFQARNGARVVWSGSVELFSDEFWLAGTTGNEAFALDVTRWAFQEKGALRIDSVFHRRVGEQTSREQYRVNDNLLYSISISQFENDAWRPVILSDLQLEVTMLDPHLRIPLLPDSLPSVDRAAPSGTSTLYTATFRLPDRHGVFALIVDHRSRFAYSGLKTRDQISVTPPRHNEYPRFIKSAWPFYTGAITSAIAWVIFCAIWLALDPTEKGKGRES